MGVQKPGLAAELREAFASPVEKSLSAAGVFKGMHGLEGLAKSQSFWDQQPYGTRLYYDEGGADYLHRDVLQASVKRLAQLEEDCAALRKHLRFALQEIDHDRLRATKKVADHECDFYHNPEAGHCAFCDNYTAAWTAIDATHFEEEE